MGVSAGERGTFWALFLRLRRGSRQGSPHHTDLPQKGASGSSDSSCPACFPWCLPPSASRDHRSLSRFGDARWSAPRGGAGSCPGAFSNSHKAPCRPWPRHNQLGAGDVLVFPFHLLDPSSLLLPMPRGPGAQGKGGPAFGPGALECGLYLVATGHRQLCSSGQSLRVIGPCWQCL